MSYIAFIPLRGGSKSIPHKNIRSIGGKPLCHWTIEAAHACPRLERIFVSTDSEEIRQSVEALQLPRVEVIGRSAATATDTASTESAMLEFAQARDFAHLVLIQATSPLLQAADLTGGIGQFECSGADSLLSVVEQKRFLWSRAKTGFFQPQNYSVDARPRRQDFDPYYVENGAFYICARAGLLASQSRLHGHISAYVMPEETYNELDEPVDWIVIEQILEQRRAAESSADRRRRLESIKLVLTDVDGVLTDAGMYYSNGGEEQKKFNTRDGKGMELLRLAGFQTGIITTEDTAIVTNRARKLKVDFLHQGVTDKRTVVQGLLKSANLQLHEVAYIGDDINDLELLRAVGFSGCPADAVTEVRNAVHYHCRVPGGGGAFREFAEVILDGRQP